MPKVTLDDVQAIPDPMLSDHFELTIPSPPAGNAQQLRIRCKSAVKPGVTIEEQLVEIFGHAMNHAGRKIFSRSMSVTYVESSDLEIHNTFEKWIELIRGTETQIGAFKKDYSCTAVLRIFKQDGSVAGTYDIHRLWPKSVPDATLDGTATAIEVAIDFSYDYWKPA